MVFDYGKTAATLRTISTHCHLILTEWEHLWTLIEAYDIDDRQARESIQDIRKREIIVFSGHDAALDDSLNEASQKAAFKVVEERYAA